MKHFISQSKMHRGNNGPESGISDYEMTRDLDGELVFMLRGTFSWPELQAMANAILVENEKFEFPNHVD